MEEGQSQQLVSTPRAQMEDTLNQLNSASKFRLEVTSNQFNYNQSLQIGQTPDQLFFNPRSQLEITPAQNIYNSMSQMKIFPNQQVTDTSFRMEYVPTQLISKPISQLEVTSNQPVPILNQVEDTSNLFISNSSPQLEENSTQPISNLTRSENTPNQPISIPNPQIKVISNQLNSYPRPQMDITTRQSISEYLQRNCDNDKLKYGTIHAAAKLFNFSRRTISRIWKEVQLAKLRNLYLTFENHPKKKGSCGRKRKDYTENFKKMKYLPLEHRNSLRNLSKALEIPKSTLHRFLREGKIYKRDLPSSNKNDIAEETTTNDNLQVGVNQFSNLLSFPLPNKELSALNNNPFFYDIKEEEFDFDNCSSTTHSEISQPLTTNNTTPLLPDIFLPLLKLKPPKKRGRAQKGLIRQTW